VDSLISGGRAKRRLRIERGELRMKGDFPVLSSGKSLFL
jgi:hypothetical protein